MKAASSRIANAPVVIRGMATFNSLMRRKAGAGATRVASSRNQSYDAVINYRANEPYQAAKLKVRHISQRCQPSVGGMETNSMADNRGFYEASISGS